MKFHQLAIAISLCAVTAQYATAEIKDAFQSDEKIYNITGENYTYVPATYSDEEYAARVQYLLEIEKRAKTDFARNNPRAADQMFRKIFKSDIRSVRGNFNDDGSWKEELGPVVPVEKVRRHLPSADHILFFNELYALAYSYKFGDKGSPRVKADQSLYGDDSVVELIYKAINWYIGLDITPEPQWRDTFKYGQSYETLATSMNMLGLLLVDEIHKDKESNELAANVYNFIDQYGRQIIREQPQRRGPNWSARYSNAMEYVLFTRNPHRMDEYMHYIDESHTFNEVQSTGVHPDWSMQHHGDMMYWGQYGHVWIGRMVKNLGMDVKDTPWAYSKREINFLENAMLDGARWVYYRGNVDYVTAPKRATLQLGKTDSTPGEFIELLGYMLKVGGDKLERRDEIEFLIENMTPSINELDKYADNQELPGHKYFWVTEYQNHRRNNFSIAVKRQSQRTRGPGDSNANLHLGFGAGYTSLLRRGDETRFSRYAWNFLDMPGTTLEQGRVVAGGRAGATRRGLNLYSGAVTDGMYGAGAFEQQIVEYQSNGRVGPTVVRTMNDKEVEVASLNSAGALKGNMFFDVGMVALGHDIRNLEESDKIVRQMAGGKESHGNILTTLNNTLLRGEVVYSVDNQKPISINMRQQSLNALQPEESMWVWHDNVGYIINKASDEELNVTLSTEHKPFHPLLENDRSFLKTLGRTSYRASVKSKTLPMFLLHIDHGQVPQNDKYEYFVVMDKTLDEFKAFVEDQDGINVVKNSKGIQAVQQGNDLYYALFQNPGEVTFADGKTIKTHKPMMVMARKTETGYDVTASNPLHLGSRQSYVPGTENAIGHFYKEGIEVTFNGFSTDEEPQNVRFVFPGEPLLADGQSITHSI